MTAVPPAVGATPQTSEPHLSWRARAAIFLRLLAVQSAWNYELMLGTGIGFCTEPALRTLPGGPAGTAYHEALARESRYFNAHPYLAAVAVGALARAELEGQPPAQIERFRAAMCGPLGSLGDRLVWAGWLPFSALLALLAFGLGAGGVTVVVTFLVVYNAGHIGLRIWGLRVGWRSGLRVAAALGAPALRRGPQLITRAVMVLAGAALPLAIRRVLAGVPLSPPASDTVVRALGGIAPAAAILGAVALGAILVRLHGRMEGWRAALAILAALIIYSVLR
ncbi:MAG: PTS system mannose/fructose/sorbose family transporter subunit IID [Gemmatimonadaceae bacterium]|nr:PTS system mannose/fructose/sorbose family transporter subunit IID [Gemmatimonadaceae bacterium]